MLIRVLDIYLAAGLLLLVSPLLVASAVIIKLTSPGPVFYRANRVGLHGEIFTMFKLRSMHVNNKGSMITASSDPRIFGFGKVLRLSKLDEFPQLFNIIIGDMSVVGTRPEDPQIVASQYTAGMRKTLEARPGLTSPGSLYYYTEQEDEMIGDDHERIYVERVMPIKLKIDELFLQDLTVWKYNRTIAQTFLSVIFKVLKIKSAFNHNLVDRAKAALATEQ